MQTIAALVVNGRVQRDVVVSFLLLPEAFDAMFPFKEKKVLPGQIF